MRRFLILFSRLGRRDLRLLWYALRHPARPAWLLPVVGLLALFALEPANFAFLPLGILDDLVILPMVLHALLGRLPPAIHQGFLAREPVSHARAWRREPPRADAYRR